MVVSKLIFASDIAGVKRPNKAAQDVSDFDAGAGVKEKGKMCGAEVAGRGDSNK